MAEKCCANCVHCHKTKELKDKNWIKYNICTLWKDYGETHEPLLLTLGNDIDVNEDLCECFESKEEFWKKRNEVCDNIHGVIDDLQYLISDGCTDTQKDYYEEMEDAIKYLQYLKEWARYKD